MQIILGHVDDHSLTILYYAFSHHTAVWMREYWWYLFPAFSGFAIGIIPNTKYNISVTRVDNSQKMGLALYPGASNLANFFLSSYLEGYRAPRCQLNSFQHDKAAFFTKWIFLIDLSARKSFYHKKRGIVSLPKLSYKCFLSKNHYIVGKNEHL